jgi:hypothetical protein
VDFGMVCLAVEKSRAWGVKSMQKSRKKLIFSIVTQRVVNSNRSNAAFFVYKAINAQSEHLVELTG